MKKKLIIGCTFFACFLSCKKTEELSVLKPNVIIEKNVITKKIENKPSFSFNLLKKDSDERPSEIKIEITQNNKITQIIIYKPDTWQIAEEPFKVRQINYFKNDIQIKEGIENFHEFITGDFNFDNLEDFAILYDFGGNGGPSYSYYFQNKNGEFNLQKVFPLNQGYFPKKIDHVNQTLTTISPIGCCKTLTTIFNLNKSNFWKVISEKEEDMK